MAFVAVIAMCSCENDLPLYSTETCRLNFYYADYSYEQTQGSYSFVFKSADRSVDTVWYEVETMGFVSKHDRNLALEQVDTAGVENAVAGVHYVAFNDPSVAGLYVMPAGKSRTKIPVIVKRDATLKSKTVVLKFRIKPNAEFENGYARLQTRALEITDRLARPSNWYSPIFYSGAYSLYNLIGEYGTVKHQILIDATGFSWDDDFIDEMSAKDTNYLSYILGKAEALFLQISAQRAAEGLPPLTEEDGREVSFEFIR